MPHSVLPATEEARVAALKRLIRAGKFDSLEKLEDAVDAFLWSEHDRQQEERSRASDKQLVRARPR